MFVVKPWNERILVQRLSEETITKGGLFIPETAKERGYRAKVLAVGPGKFTESMERQPILLKPGQTIFVSKWAGSDLTIGEQECAFITEHDVLGVLEDGQEV